MSGICTVGSWWRYTLTTNNSFYRTHKHIKALIGAALGTSGWSHFCKIVGINCAVATFIEVIAPITSPGYINIIFWRECS